MYVMKKKKFMYTKKILPEGWKKKVLAAVFLAVLGNILVQYVIPWPEFMTVSYEAAAEELAAYPLGVYLALTLLIAPLLEEGIQVKDPKLMFKLIRASFNQRRKTLQNGIANSPELPYSKAQVEKALEKMGLAANVRGESLTLAEFAKLSDIISEE